VKGKLFRDANAQNSSKKVFLTRNMAFVNVPKDLSKIKNKAFFNLTARQLICFGSAAAVGIPAYIFTRIPLGTTAAALLMIGLMLPFFFFAMYEKDGQPAEKALRNIVRTRIYFPGKRPYKTDNLYEILEREGKSLAEQNTAKAQAAPNKGRKPKK
jgi:hypothetical protein